MRSITIGRYDRAAKHGLTVAQGSIDIPNIYAGWIEGIRDDGTTWIMWLDAKGSPECFWGQRDPDGGVDGDPILLS